MLEIPMHTGTVPTRDTCLLVVDMQKGFFDNRYTLGQVGMDVTLLRDAIPGTVRLVDLARTAGVPVIFTRFVYAYGLSDFPLHRRARNAARLRLNSLGEGTEEIELLPELEARPNEIVIDKSRPSSFYGTRLEPVLTSAGIRNIVVCGVTTNICVETTVRDAGQRDYGTFVVRDAVAEMDAGRNHYALFGMAWSFADVVTVDDIARSWLSMNT
jgi:ureidoacrylate peracid hydrolase